MLIQIHISTHASIHHGIYINLATIGVCCRCGRRAASYWLLLEVSCCNACWTAGMWEKGCKNKTIRSDRSSANTLLVYVYGDKAVQKHPFGLVSYLF